MVCACALVELLVILWVGVRFLVFGFADLRWLCSVCVGVLCSGLRWFWILDFGVGLL